MNWLRWLLSMASGPACTRSYGRNCPLVHSATALALIGFACLLGAPTPAASADRPVKIIAFGDSLIAGFGLPVQAAFPARLEAALKAKGLAVEIENAGVSGDTASAGLARLDWSIPGGTDAVIVELGANDMLRGVDPKVTRKALDEILRRLTRRGIAVLLCGMRAAPNLGEDYGRAFETVFSELARTYDVVFYPFFLQGIAAQAKFVLRDGLHPNEAGVDAIVAGILPKAEELLAHVRAKRGS